VNANSVDCSGSRSRQKTARRLAAASGVMLTGALAREKMLKARTLKATASRESYPMKILIIRAAVARMQTLARNRSRSQARRVRGGLEAGRRSTALDACSTGIPVGRG